MPSTYTTNTGLEKIATGEQDGTWGDTVNYNMDMLDVAVNGSLSITLVAAGTSGSPNTLDITDGTIDEGLYKYITITDGGDLGADVFVQLTPNTAQKVCYIRNSLSGSQDLYLFQGTYDAARDYVLAAGDTAVVAFSGAGASSSTATEIIFGFDRASPGAIGATTPAAGSFTALTATGAFTSIGIDDNATAEMLQLADNLMTLGTSNGPFVIVHVDTDTSIAVSGGSSADLGANVVFYGEAHATLANDIQFRGSATTQLYYDDSASSWDFQANAIITTGTLGAGACTLGATTVTTLGGTGALSGFTTGAFSSTLTSGTHTVSSDLALASGSITSVSGAISFGNENLTTTGTLASGAHTVSSDLVMASGSITSVSGAISFGNENLTTTGTLTSGTHTVSSDLALASGSITSVSGAISFGNENLTTSGNISISGTTGGLTIGSGSFNTVSMGNQLTLRRDSINYIDFGTTADTGSLYFRAGAAGATVFRMTGSTGAIDTNSGAFTCGAFTSAGIDDNATLGVTLTVDDAGIVLTGASKNPAIFSDVDDGTMRLCSSTGVLSGSSLLLYGGTHASAAGDIAFYAGAGLELQYDNSGSWWDFQQNTIYMNKTTADEPFINFQATADADTTSAISTLTTSGATTHHIQVDINGTKAWIAVSTNNPS